ncbi:hypothetical protein D9619_008416 [Psilocybe cf. subviscida]|uniref:Uncharacterized protein n=1 Tax=Psilocybe cf. subviscida TaxID=2480587 RepID=A0A8H5F0M3_9AGAR|nr:hypothetical protein D9619_008416 [Psilocybe cf. subviscida]
MDPLSITLAVISLTTAVKDMVELGQKIHESFAKVSTNLRNAQRVAEDIKELVEEIKVFCDGHKEALNNMKDFRLAIHGLLGKLRSFETSILPLLPQTGGRRRDRFFQGWDAWRNNDRVEESIVHLQSDIVKVIRRHIMKSAMRTEVKLEAIHQDAGSGFISITQDLEVVRRDVSAIAAVAVPHYSYESSATFRNQLNHSIDMFARSSPSTSVPMLRTPNVITEEVTTTIYIKAQIDSIAMIVKKMSMLPASAGNHAVSNSVTQFMMEPEIKEESMSITHLRRHAVREVSSIRDLLDTPSGRVISIQDGATALIRLSAALEILGMDHESRLLRTWSITLARLLFDASGGEQPDHGAHLALCLLHQSWGYDSSGDRIQSLRVIEEAHTITQNLSNRYSGQVSLQILYSYVLLEHASLVSSEQSLKMSIEAIQVLEGILNIRAFTQSTSFDKIEGVVEPSSAFLHRLFSSTPPINAVRIYAYALQNLGYYLVIGGNPQNSLNLARLAIALRRKVVSIYGHEHKAALAFALSVLVEDETANHIPREELVNLADECIQLLRELTEKNPLFYARKLVSVLWVKATALQRLNRNTEAVTTWEEAASLAGRIIQDSELHATVLLNLSSELRFSERYDDAVRTRRLAINMYQHEDETQAKHYLFLCQDLQHLRCYKESVNAAQMSVTLYRRLAIKDPERWTSFLTHGLSKLALCMARSGDYSEARIAWMESVTMLDSYLNTNPNANMAVIDRYLGVNGLDIRPFISYILQNKEESLKVCSTAVQYLRQLSDTYPQNAHIFLLYLLQAEFCYAYNMLRFGCLQDVLQFIGHWPDRWRNKPGPIPDSEIGRWHAALITLKADALHAQGCTEQALLATRTVHDITTLSVSTNLPSFHEMICSMIQEAQLRVALGDSKGALQVAEEALRLSKGHKLKQIEIDCLVRSLHGVAFSALSCCNYTRAIEAAQEGFDITSNSIWRYSNSEYRIFLRPSMFSVLSSAEANLGRYGIALDYARRAVDASLEIGWMKAYISATTVERSCMETRGNLAEILLATGDLVQARQICQELRAYFSDIVETRMGGYRDLGPILRMLGILCCSEGHHEEGDAAAKELTQIMKTLGAAFPSLQEEVKIRLRHQTQVPILKILDEMCEKLDCGHQAGIISLFTV